MLQRERKRRQEAVRRSAPPAARSRRSPRRRSSRSSRSSCRSRSPRTIIESIVDDVIAENGATNMRDLGRVMADVMPQIAGRADGRSARSSARSSPDVGRRAAPWSVKAETGGRRSERSRSASVRRTRRRPSRTTASRPRRVRRWTDQSSIAVELCAPCSAETEASQARLPRNAGTRYRAARAPCALFEASRRRLEHLLLAGVVSPASERSLPPAKRGARRLSSRSCRRRRRHLRPDAACLRSRPVADEHRRGRGRRRRRGHLVSPLHRDRLRGVRPRRSTGGARKRDAELRGDVHHEAGAARSRRPAPPRRTTGH